MSTKKLSNIPLKTFRKFLESQNLNLIKTKGGHETYSRKDLLRPIIIQSHISPIPIHIVKQVLRHLKMNRNEFYKVITKTK